MDSRHLARLRERLQPKVDQLDLRGTDIPSFHEYLVQFRQRPVYLICCPLGPESFGLWVAADTFDCIYYEQNTTPYHQRHLVLHEGSHMLLGHKGRPLDDVVGEVAPNLSPRLIRLLLGHSVFEEEQEAEAEVLATLIEARIGPWGATANPPRQSQDHPPHLRVLPPGPVAVDSPLLIMAILTTLVALYELRSVLRHPIAVVASYWAALLFVSIAIMVRTPTPSEWIDQLAGVPHVSRLFSNVCTVLALLAAQNAVYTGLISPRRLRHLRAFAMAFASATLLAMIVLFVKAAPLEPESDIWRSYAINGMASYRFIFLAYLGVSFALVTGVWSRYAFLSHGPHLRTAFTLMAAGGAFGTAYVLNGLGTLLRSLEASTISWWGNQGLSDPLVAAAIGLVLLGALTQVWFRVVDGLHKHRAFLTLRPLWHGISEMRPDAVLLPKRPLWRDLLDIRDADFRLRRQVTEIRDARLLLKGRGHPAARAAAAKVATDSAMDDREQSALIQAVLLRTVMQQPASIIPAEAARSEPDTSIEWSPLFDGRDLWAETSYLTRVARHFRGSLPLDQTLDILAAVKNANEEEHVAG